MGATIAFTKKLLRKINWICYFYRQTHKKWQMCTAIHKYTHNTKCFEEFFTCLYTIIWRIFTTSHQLIARLCLILHIYHTFCHFLHNLIAKNPMWISFRGRPYIFLLINPDWPDAFYSLFYMEFHFLGHTLMFIHFPEA